MFIDTHAHLDFPEFENDREEVSKRAFEGGVDAVLTVGTDLPSSRKSVELAHRYERVFAAVGVHPHEADRVTDDEIVELEELSHHPWVVAIGEVGLDYYRGYAQPRNQKALFRKMIGLANRRGLPLIIHNRNAHRDVIAILNEEMTESLRGVFHCFSGDEAFLQKVLDLNFLVSFTGNITYKNTPLVPIVGMVPLEKILLETDAPFLAPEGRRGKRNEPAWVVEVAQKIAGIKGISLEEVGRVTSENARRLFRFWNK